MRKLVVVALAGILTLAVAAVAIAATATSGTTVQNYEQTYTAKKPKKSTGTSFSTNSTDEQNTQKNKQPKRVTKIDSKAAPQCKADENDFAAEDDPDDACPKGSKIGSGAVKARLPYNNTSELDGTVTAFNANKGLLLWVQVNAPGAAQTLLIKPKFSGLNLKTKVPVTCVPPGNPPDCKDATGQEQAAVLTSFNLKTKAVTTKKGKKRQLITTPPT